MTRAPFAYDSLHGDMAFPHRTFPNISFSWLMTEISALRQGKTRGFISVRKETEHVIVSYTS
jgi:hypothetical protein